MEREAPSREPPSGERAGSATVGPPSPTPGEHPGWRSAVVGFLLAAVVLAVLLAVVGVEQVGRTLAGADPVAVLAVALLAVGWMVAWSHSLRLVLATLDVDTTARRAFQLYAATLLANNVAPFSVFGAEPLAALFVSRGTRSTYERSFAAVVSTDVVNFLPAPAFALCGVLSVGATATLGRTVDVVVGSLFAVLLVLVAGGVLGWRYRDRLARQAVGFTGVVDAWLVRLAPGVRVPDASVLAARVESGLDALERVAADRRALADGLAAATVGWLALSLMCWTALLAVGVRVPVAAPLFVVPLATVTDLVPLPGGVGSVDAALVLLLVATAGVPAAGATAAVIVYRAGSFLLPILVGGLAVAFLDTS